MVPKYKVGDKVVVVTDHPYYSSYKGQVLTIKRIWRACGCPDGPLLGFKEITCTMCSTRVEPYEEYSTVDPTFAARAKLAECDARLTKLDAAYAAEVQRVTAQHRSALNAARDARCAALQEWNAIVAKAKAAGQEAAKS